MNHRTIANFFALFLLWLCTMGLMKGVMAQSGGRESLRSASIIRRTEEVEEPTERECEIVQEDDEVEFECKVKSDDGDTKIKDEIEYKVKTSSRGLSVKIEYEQEIDTDETKTESETQFDVHFTTIVEYFRADDAPDDAYNWEEDTIVQSLDLSSRLGDFSSIVDDEDGVTSTFSVSDTNDLFTFTFHVSRATDDEQMVTANKMKIDFRLTNFPWVRDDTSVALLCTIESKKEVEVEYDDDDDDSADGAEQTSKKTKDVIIAFNNDNDSLPFIPFGEYTWAETAVVAANETTSNGTDLVEDESMSTTIQVVATSPPLEGNETYQMIAFSFVGDSAKSASDIFWDPEAGIGYSTSGVDGIISSLGILGGMIGTMFILAY